MANWKSFIDRIESLSSELVLADLSVPEDFTRVYAILSQLRSEPDIKGQALLARALVSAATAVSSLKASQPARAGEILSCLCMSLKAALECLDRSEAPDAHIASFLEKMKEIMGGVKAQPKISDAQAQEIPGFVVNARGLLDEGEQALLALEKSPSDKSRLDEVFRLFHTIKGEANLTGLGSLSKLAHEAEDFLGALRTGTLTMNSDVATALLKVVDQLRNLLSLVEKDPAAGANENVTSFIQELQAARARKIRVEAVVAVPPPQAAVSSPVHAILHAPCAPLESRANRRFV